VRLRRHWGAVDEIVSATLERAKGLTRSHDVRVEIEAELPVLRVDDRAVSEVLYTLLDNAVKYSPRQGVITIAARRGGNDLIEISVEDLGRGIPLALRERVFDKFYRATSDSNVRIPSGTGMGLAIAKGIVEAHQGNIWIEDGKDEKGTRVVFTLPIGDDESDHFTEQPIDSVIESIN